MSRNGQGRHKKRLEPWICTRCKENNCYDCVDIGRILMCAKLSEFVPLCKCKRPGHEGTEPNTVQIRDPFDGSVHAPGLIVTEDGEVIRHE